MTDTDENVDDQEATVINDEWGVGFDIDKGKRKVGFMGGLPQRKIFLQERGRSRRHEGHLQPEVAESTAYR